MDTKHLATIQHPGPAPAHIIESNTLTFATDKNGTAVLDGDGNKTLLAHDTGGNWYAKLAREWPQSKTERAAMESEDAFYYASNNPSYRGVWMAIPEAKGK